MIRRRLLSAVIVAVAVPALGLVLPEPEHCTAPPAVVEGQAMRCSPPRPPAVLDRAAGTSVERGLTPHGR